MAADTAGAVAEQPLVQLDDLACGYSGRAVLDRISLRLYVGQFAGIVGPSGSGKTTLLPVSYTHLTLPTTPYV